jgi:hypothetical protein
MSENILGFTLDKTSCVLHPYNGPQKLVQSLILAHINYSYASSRKLGVASNSCLRYVHGLGRRDSVAHLQCSINGLGLKASATLQQLRFLFKVMQSQHPSYIFSLVQYTVGIREPTLYVTILFAEYKITFSKSD